MHREVTCGNNRPLAFDRLTYDPATEQLTYRSDKADGPTAGTQALDPLEFLARFSAEPQSVPVSRLAVDATYRADG